MGVIVSDSTMTPTLIAAETKPAIQAFLIFFPILAFRMSALIGTSSDALGGWNGSVGMCARVCLCRGPFCCDAAP